MTIDLITVGKTDSGEVAQLVAMYQKRINRYVKFSVIQLPDIRNAKNMPEESLKREEGTMILKNIADGDHMVLLDDKSREHTSPGFADWLQKKMNGGVRRLVFVIGGAYGFSSAVKERANDAVSLSKMTFSHQIVRAIFAEQLYRAFTILNNEPYHHE